MPPGQPVHRCTGPCGRYRPCRRHDGAWYCRECHPALQARADTDAASADVSAPRTAATDGGRDR